MTIQPPKTDSKLIRAYSAPPWFYDIRGFFILTFAYRSTLWLQIKLFGNNMGKKHLEVAVGTGSLFFMILLWRKLRGIPPVEVTAIDYVPSMLEGGKKFFKNNPHVKLEVGDVTKLNFPSDTFDTVNIANSMHCFSDIDTAMKEVFRVLKPGGTFASNTILHARGIFPFKQIANRINSWGKRKGILYRSYEESEIRNIIQKPGFQIVFEKVSGNSYNVIVRKPSL